MAALLRQHAWSAPGPAPHRPTGGEGMMGALARMADAVGVPPTRLMRDFAGLSLGPGRISFTDYERLGLFDEALWAGADRRAVVGRGRGRQLCLRANFRRDLFALATNRLASGAYLAAHGLPTAPIEAIFSDGLATPAPNVLRTRDELRQFLERRARRPLIGRPAEGGRARLIADEGPAAIDRLVDELSETHGGGYLFQPWIAPHPEVAPLTGGTLAAVRFLTLNSEHGPKVFRALWKLPGRASPVAQLDLTTGQVLRLVSAEGEELVETRRGRRAAGGLVGARICGWEALKAAAVEGARVMRQLPLLGWDVAPAESGPVILGLTPTPDLVIHQVADRRGVLDAEFLAFLEAQRVAAAEYAALVRSERAWS